MVMVDLSWQYGVGLVWKHFQWVEAQRERMERDSRCFTFYRG